MMNKYHQIFFITGALEGTKCKKVYLNLASAFDSWSQLIFSVGVEILAPEQQELTR